MSGSLPQREETENEVSLRLNVAEKQTLFSLTSPVSDDLVFFGSNNADSTKCNTNNKHGDGLPEGVACRSVTEPRPLNEGISIIRHQQQRFVGPVATINGGSGSPNLQSVFSVGGEDIQRTNDNNSSSGLVCAANTCGPSTFSRRGGAGGAASLPHVIPSSRSVVLTTPSTTVSGGRLGVARYIRMILSFPSVLGRAMCSQGNHKSNNLSKNMSSHNDPLSSPLSGHNHNNQGTQHQYERYLSPTSATLLPELVRHHDVAEGIVSRGGSSTQEEQSAIGSAGCGARLVATSSSATPMVIKLIFWILGFLVLLVVSGTVEYILREQRDHPEADALSVLIDLGRWVVGKTSLASTHGNLRRKSGGDRSSGGDSFMSYLYDEDESEQERNGKKSTKGGSGEVANNNQKEAFSSPSSTSATAGLGVLLLRRVIAEYIEKLDNNYSFGIDAKGKVYREEKHSSATQQYPPIIDHSILGAAVVAEGGVAGESTPTKGTASSQQVPPFSLSSSSSSLLFVPDRDFPSLPLSLPAWPRPFGLTEANEVRLPAGRLMRRMLGSENSIDDYDYDSYHHHYYSTERQSPIRMMGTKKSNPRARGGGGGGFLPSQWCFSKNHTHHWYSVWKKRLDIERTRAVSACHSGKDRSLMARILGGGALPSSSSPSSSSLLGLSPASRSTSYLYREVLAESGLLLFGNKKRGEEEGMAADMADSIAVLAEAFHRYGSSSSSSGDGCEGRRGGAKKEAYSAQNASGVDISYQQMQDEANMMRSVPAYATICGNKDAPILASHFASFHNISLGRFILVLNTHEPKWVALGKFLEELFPQRFVVEYAMVITRALWEGQREYRRRHNGSFGIPKRNHSSSRKSPFAAFSPAKTKALFAKEDAEDDALDKAFERMHRGSGDTDEGIGRRRVFSTRLYRWHLRNFHPDLLSGVRTLAPMHSVSMGWNRIAHLCFRGVNPVGYVTIANGDFYLIGDELGDYSAYVASMVSAGEKRTIDDHNDGEDGGGEGAKGRRSNRRRARSNMTVKKGSGLPTKSRPAVLGGYQDTLLFSFISYTFRGWQRFGEFDESFFPMYSEDNEFHERIRSAGYEVFPSYDKVCLARGNRKKRNGGDSTQNRSDLKKGDGSYRQTSDRDADDDGGVVSTMIVGGAGAGSGGRRLDRNRRFEFVHYHHVGSLSRDKKNRAQSDLLEVLRSSQSHGHYRYYKYMAQPDPEAMHNYYPTFSSPFNNPSISHRNSWAIDARYRRCLLDPKAFPSRICRMDVRNIQELLLGTYRNVHVPLNDEK